jgi:transcriptional regulator with XRE-family HTH domain
MPEYSHGAKYSSTANIRVARNDGRCSPAYHANMPRKSAKAEGARPEQPDWYLQEWMRSKRVSQAWLAKECDWTPSTMHGIYHGRTSYYRDILNLIASKLNVEPFELLMHPEEANAFKQFQHNAAEVVKLVDRRTDQREDEREKIRARK